MNPIRRPALLAAGLFAFTAAPAAAQMAGPLPFDLEAASDWTQGCYPPCLCPIWFQDELIGTFTLQFTLTDAAGFDRYDVLNVDWYLGPSLDHVTGQGEYLRGGPLALEQLVLDLSVNGAAPQHFDSGLVQPQAAFPAIDVSISINGMYCYDTVYRVVGAPNLAGSAFCAGDGSGTVCPCGNAGAPGQGCASSVNAAGASLSGSGVASLGADTVALDSAGTPNAPLLFFQGTLQVNAGAGAVFGDGLRCAGGSVVRLKSVPASSGQARIPGPGDPALSVLGGIGAPGVRTYQVWYRNAAAFCTSATFNLSNGFEITWSP